MAAEATVEPTTVGGRYSIVGTGFDRPVLVVTDWAAPHWIDVDGDGNLDYHDTLAPAKPGSFKIELRQVSAADHKKHGYPYPQARDEIPAVPARDPDPEHPEFNNPDNDIDGSHPGTPAVPGQDGVEATDTVATLTLKVAKP